MNRHRQFKILITATIGLLLLMSWLDVPRADPNPKPVPQILSSITEFKACVAFQNEVPLEQVRVIWDVQTAACHVVLADGRIISVPNFIEEVENFAIVESFRKEGI